MTQEIAQKSDAPLSVADICDVLGRRNVALAVGVRATSVSNAVVEGRFPAKWYLVIAEMCRTADIPCPNELFSFVAVETMKEAS